MRQGLTGILLAALLGIPASASGAQLPYAGVLFAPVLNLPIAFPASGTAQVGGAGNHIETLSLDPGDMGGMLVFPVNDPAAAPIVAIELTLANGAGAFAESAGQLGGPMALSGVTRICLFDPVCTTAVSVPLTSGGTRGIGLGGTVTGGNPLFFNVTVIGAPWTTGTAFVTSLFGGTSTQQGFRHGPLSGTGSSAAQGGGVVSLVTPIRVVTDLGLGQSFSSFARLTVTLVPEPGTALLLGAGVAALGMRGWRRVRR